MLPNPLHPAVVHFPIVLMFVLPISAIAAIWAIWRGARAARAWLVPLAVASALAGSVWLGVETGEAQEERVEGVVAEHVVEAHAAAAETFMRLSMVTLMIVAAGLAPGRWGVVARGAATAAAIGLVVAGTRVGHSGGQLVYQHGAASAYVAMDGKASPSGPPSGPSRRERDEHDQTRENP